MKYRASFYLKNISPIEFLVMLKENKVMSKEPGQAALKLVNLKKSGENKFEPYCDLFEINDIKDVYRTITSKTEIIERLGLESDRLQGFIRDVLLPLPPDYPSMENITTDKRIAMFIITSGYRPGLENLFRQISIVPYAPPGDNIYSLQGSEQTKALEKHEKAWESITENRGDDKPRRDLSMFYSFAWRYESDNILSIAWLELFQIAEAGLKIKSCRKCDNFYVPIPPNALHCPKCKQKYSAQELYREKQKELKGELTPQQIKRDKLEKRNYMREYRKKKKAEKEQAEKAKSERQKHREE